MHSWLPPPTPPIDITGPGADQLQLVVGVSRIGSVYLKSEDAPDPNIQETPLLCRREHGQRALDTL